MGPNAGGGAALPVGVGGLAAVAMLEKPKPSNIWLTAVRLPCFIVLDLNFQAGAGLQTGEHGTDGGARQAEHDGLVQALVVPEVDGEIVSPFLAEQEEGRYQESLEIAAVYLLAVLDGADHRIGDGEAVLAAAISHLFGGGEIQLAVVSHLEGTDSAADEFGVAVGRMEGEQREGEAQNQFQAKAAEMSHHSGSGKRVEKISVISQPGGLARRPVLREHNESSLDGLFVVGDLAGAPLIKLALEQGEQLARHLEAKLREPHGADWDVVVVGAGAAGLAVALRLKQLGRRVLVVEKREIVATFRDFPEGKRIYDEPKQRGNPSALDFGEASKEELVERWRRQVAEADLEVRAGEEVTGVEPGAVMRVRSERGEYRTRYVVLASGVRGNPRRLGIAGEDDMRVMHRLYNPQAFRGERILVVGGGNTAVEAAVALSGDNEVVLLHRGGTLGRASRQNRERLEASGVVVRLKTELRSMEQADGYDRVFVLIGAEAQEDFLRRLGLRLEGEWDWRRWVGLALSFVIAYTIYGVKVGRGEEFWPFTGWGYEALSFFGRGWSFWYTVLYTGVVTVFGLQAMRRWGRDRFQRWRFGTLIGFQWTFFFLIPEFLFDWAVRYEWVGAALARDPDFAGAAWRSYGIVYAWPLFFYTFFSNPHEVWVVWGVVLSFVLLPVLVLLHGKRYCSWICGCGGLAETLGDRWRHLAPKGEAALRWERMNGVVLGAAVVVTVLMLCQDVVAVFRGPAGVGIRYYRLVVDTWLVGIVPVALYPFFGGKVWCRYWCPLAKMMEMWSAFYTRMRWSRFRITANDHCIACGECTRNCQVGIDVMKYALEQRELTNENSSCIGCGICITVCPMTVLEFGKIERPGELIQIKP